MDTALQLRLDYEKKKSLTKTKITDSLEQSELVQKLFHNFETTPLSATFRLMSLCEIPYIERTPFTQNLLEYSNRHIATAEGFSVLGGVNEIVPCYNAMLLEAYTRFGLERSNEATTALEWIKKHQLFERNLKTSWQYDGICKHGGCLGKIPCYIGIGKTVRALITYSDFTDNADLAVEKLIEQGIGYMLRHKMYQRLSNRMPISSHITNIMMPQNYALSFTDLIYIVGKRQLLQYEKAAPLLDLLREKQVSDNQWKIDYLYTYKGYVGFESRRNPSEWISNLFPIWLSQIT